MQSPYVWDDVHAPLIVGVAAFADAYLADGFALGVLAGLIFFLVSLAGFTAMKPDVV